MLLQDTIIKLEEECGCFACCAIRDLDTDETLAMYHETEVVKSASTIKTPIMLAVLQDVEVGKLSMQDLIPISQKNYTGDSQNFTEKDREATLERLVETMITYSDNTATNALIDLMGMDRINAVIRSLGMYDTVERRHMLDFAAAQRGSENTTSARDMLRLYTLIHRHELVSDKVCEMALPVLLRQRDDSLIRFAMPTQKTAHKTGGLPGIVHDTGILYGENRTLAYAVLTWADDDIKGERFIQKLSAVIKKIL